MKLPSEISILSNDWNERNHSAGRDSNDRDLIPIFNLLRSAAAEINCCTCFRQPFTWVKLDAVNFSHQASRKKIRTVRFSSFTSIFPSRASQPTAIETVDLGALIPFSSALRLDSPLERKKFHTMPAVSPIVLISTIRTSLVDSLAF
jgi:hypothetical protein